MSADHGHGAQESHGSGIERPKTGIMGMFKSLFTAFAFAGIIMSVLAPGGGDHHHDTTHATPHP